MQGQRSQPEVRRILANARCLKWSGEAMQRAWGIEWRVHPVDPHTVGDDAPHFDCSPGESWLQAMLRARLPEDERKSSETARAAFASGRRWYTHDFRCGGQDDTIWWVQEDIFLEETARKTWSLTGVVFGITPNEDAAAELRALRRTLEARVLARVAEQDAELDELHRAVAEWELMDAVNEASVRDDVAMFGGRLGGLR